MALVNKTYYYQKYLFYLISLTCIVSVLCSKNIFNELFLQKERDKICPVASDESSFSQQTFQSTDKIESFKNKDIPKEKNVLETLKVILNKVKQEVNSDSQEGSSAKDKILTLNANSVSDVKYTSESEIPKSSNENVPFKLLKISDESKLKIEKGETVVDESSIKSEISGDKQSLMKESLGIFNLSKTSSKLEDNIKSKIGTKLETSNDTITENFRTNEKQKIKQLFEDIPHRGTYTDISKLSSQPDAQNKSTVDTKLNDGVKPFPPPVAKPEEAESLQPKNYSAVVEESLQTSNKTEGEALDLGEPSVKEVPETDVNTSTVLPETELLDEARKEKDQLETYSQFAERVSAEKKNGVGNGHGTNGQSSKGSKVKSKKNYASTDCGAKFIAANLEASHSHKIINSNKDEYMLNKCTEKLWVVVELCESIKPQKFDIANFELFSNLPKEIHLYGSHRYPTREWITLGTYIGEEGNRGIQSFNIDTQEFLKYIKLEIHSHYGTEFYCPLSQFRIYGMSEFEVIEEEVEDTEEEPVLEEEDLVGPEAKTDEEKEKKRGIMIPDVLKSIFNGVLEVIKRGSRSGNLSEESELIKYNETCKSLNGEFTIKNESCYFADSLNYILACYYDEYLKLMINPFISQVVKNSNFCHRLATFICSSPQNNDSYVYDSICNNSYVCVMLSPKHILAMCHMNNPLLLSDLLACDAEEDSTDAKNLSTAGSTIGKLPIDIKVVVDEQEKITDLDGDGKLPSDEKNTTSRSQKAVPISDIEGSKSKSPSSAEDSELPVESSDTKQNAKEETKSAHPGTIEKAENASSITAEEKVGKVDKTEKQDVKKETKKVEKTQDKSSSGLEDQGLHTTTTTTTPPPSTAVPSSSTESRAPSHSNKESVVVRLSNKIKVLEQNMSISSQYLEELSRRYNIQMEEMERQFNITIHALNRTSQIAYERDLYHQKRIEGLEDQVEKLTNIITTLVQEKDSFLRNVFEHHIILLIIQVLVMAFAFTFCMKRARADLAPQEMRSFSLVASQMQNQNRMKKDKIAVSQSDQQGRDISPQFRRMSVDSLKIGNQEKPKERRFSGQTDIIGSYQDLMITESSSISTVGAPKERRRKKKKNQLQRSMSNASIPGSKDSLPVALKKEGKLEKLKKSSAGVLFGGEQINRTKSEPNSDVVGKQSVEDVRHEDWQLVKRNKGKKGKIEGSSQQEEEQNYVFSSDLKRGKITVVEEPFCDVYQHPYYADVLYDDYVYDKAYIEEEYKDYDDCDYERQMVDANGLDQISPVYTTPDFDYDAPVINDYYHSARDSQLYNVVGDEMENSPYKQAGNQDDNVDLWSSDVITKPIVKKLRNTSVPPSLKGKTRLRSDNWEWYSSQPSRLLPKSGSTEIISNSSSDNGRTKQQQQKQETKVKDKFEKKKKRKKSKLLINGENH